MFKSKQKQSSIKKEITGAMLRISLIPLVVLGVTLIVTLYFSTMQTTEDDMTEVVELASQRVEWELQTYLDLSETMGLNTILSADDTTDEERKEILSNVSDHFGLERGNYIHLDGSGIDGNEYNDRVYFQQALEGNSYISEPVVSKVTGKITIIIAAPVWKDGVSGGEVVGCVYFVPNEEFLNDIVRTISVSENNLVYMLSSTGTTVAAADSSNVESGYSIEAEAKSDKGLQDLAAIYAESHTKESGYGTATCYGTYYLVAYHSISNTDGWSLIVCAPRGDFTDELNVCVWVFIGLLIVGIACAMFFAIKRSNAIGIPMAKCTERFKQLAEGDLTSPVPEVDCNNEVGILADTTHEVVESLRTILSDVGEVLNEVAAGNLVVDMESKKDNYKGDFAPLVTTITTLCSDLRDSMSQIMSAADQVNSGAAQVASSSQSVASGATEQASAVEELASTIEEVANKSNLTKENCETAKETTKGVAETVNNAAGKVADLKVAMQAIHDSNDEINKIVKTIDDIAFQTNILALNAAVEAARAGDAGKGFSVVASEVKNLANKSQEAVQETSAIIEKTMNDINKGVTATTAVSEAMTKVGEDTNSIVDNVNVMVQDSEEQYTMIQQVSCGIEQISTVVQSNTATAEETAAASEELSGQSDILRGIVSRYKI